MKEWICKKEPLIRADGAIIGCGFRQIQELGTIIRGLSPYGWQYLLL